MSWTPSHDPGRNREARTQTPLELSYNARCVYVGNLPPTEILDNEALKSLFQRAMVERGNLHPAPERSRSTSNLPAAKSLRAAARAN